MSDKHVIEGLQILTSDKPDGLSIDAEHDKLWAGQDIKDMSDETWKAIQEVDGWFLSIEDICDKHHNEDGPMGDIKPTEEMRKCETCGYSRFGCYA